MLGFQRVFNLNLIPFSLLILPRFPQSSIVVTSSTKALIRGVCDSRRSSGRINYFLSPLRSFSGYCASVSFTLSS